MTHGKDLLKKREVNKNSSDLVIVAPAKLNRVYSLMLTVLGNSPLSNKPC